MTDSEHEQQFGGTEQAISDRTTAPTAPESAVRLPRQLSAFRHRNYRLFFGGQVVSLTGTWLQQVAHGWLVLQLTNSALMLGLVGAVTALPILIFSLPAGVLADRMRKRDLIIATQVCAMILAFALAGLTHWEIVTVYHIIAVGFMVGVVNAFDAPARQSFVIEMVGRRDLMNAIALNSATFNTARLLGPALAGIVIAAVGLAGAFFINGLSFLAVIVSLTMMRVGHRAPKAGASAIHGLMEGLQFIAGHTTVKALLTLTAVISTFATSYIVLMPIFARDILGVGPAGLGYLMSSAGAGALAGAVTISSLGDFKHKGKLLLAGNLTFCAMLVLFSLSTSLPLSMCVLVIAGWGIMTNFALTNTMIQTSVPDELRGRVMSAYTMLFLGMGLVGSLQAGVLANWLGAPSAVRIGAVICVIIAVLLSPRFVQAPASPSPSDQ